MSEQQSSKNTLVSVLAALNPLLLLVVGYFLNSGIQKTKDELERTTAQIANLKTDAEIASIHLQQRVEKVKVISGFFADLSGADDRRRKLAIQAILIALPEEAPKVLMVIESFEKDVGTDQSKEAIVARKDAIVARDTLGSVRAKLVEDMFSNVKSIRLEALATLRGGWSGDPLLVDVLLNKATADLKEQTQVRKEDATKRDDPTPGLYNTVAYFSSARVSDPDLKSRIRQFLVDIKDGGSKDTKALAASTVARFRD